MLTSKTVGDNVSDNNQASKGFPRVGTTYKTPCNIQISYEFRF